MFSFLCIGEKISNKIVKKTLLLAEWAGMVVVIGYIAAIYTIY